MKKRIPLYELIHRLDSKEKIFIKKYLSENLNISSKKSYLDFYNVLLKTNKLNDDEVLTKLSKNKLKGYLSEAKFYLNTLIVKALRIHYTLNPKINNSTDSFLSNLERQKEIYVYFSKGLYKDAAILCKKYAKEWEEKNDFSMLSFVYKKMHQIELITGINQVNNNKYFELFNKLHQANIEKSKYYYLSLKIEKEMQNIAIARTIDDINLFENFLRLDIMLNKNISDIHYWYIQILCNYTMLNLSNLTYSFAHLYNQLETNDITHDYTASKLQLANRLTYISIQLSDKSYYFYFKNYYLNLILNSTFLSETYDKIHKLNLKIIESLFLFKQKKYREMLSINIPNLDINNYIFEGTTMLHYDDLLFAKGKANFKLSNFDKALDYFNFIIIYKKKIRANAFTVCNAFFHLWLIRYIAKEYKVLKSITNRYKIFLSKNKIKFSIEKALLKFMYSSSNNFTKENINKNKNKLLQTFETLILEPINKHLINKLDIIIFLKKLTD